MRNAFEQNMQRGDIALMIDSVKMHRTSPRVLELGCGTGNLTMLFLTQGCTVTGVDLSAEMVEVLKAKLGPVVVVGASWVTRSVLGLPRGEDYLISWPPGASRGRRRIRTHAEASSGRVG